MLNAFYLFLHPSRSHNTQTICINKYLAYIKINVQDFLPKVDVPDISTTHDVIFCINNKYLYIYLLYICPQNTFLKSFLISKAFYHIVKQCDFTHLLVL